MKIKTKHILFPLAIFAVVFCISFPKQLFNDPYSTIVLDEKGELLAGKIASDGQWRFPAVDSVPNNFKECILQYEDAYFPYHLGVNPISIFRAVWNNIRQGKITSGGSTISMQVIRLSRKNQPRTYWEKCKELYLSTRLEMGYSKADILKMYASHAPYGGNVVGAEAASWRYFERPLHQLSWAENAMLAVLPNAPSLLHLGKNRTKLKDKRNALLKKLYTNDVLDSLSYSLSIMEPLPDKPNATPLLGYHALTFAEGKGKEGERIHTTLTANLQKQVDEKVNRYVRYLSQNQVNNACAIVVSLKTGKVQAYVGNSSIKQTRAPYVDLIQSPRSSGSILKPFLYAEAMADGQIHNTTLLKDVPISIGKFAPDNFDKNFDGVVPAGQALARSLNIPATLLLRDYGLIKFHDDLHALGFSTINRSADNYGLTLILGGAEVSLWELAKIYTQQSQQLLPHQNEVFQGMHLWENDSVIVGKSIDVGAWYQVAEALTDVQRPDLNQSWKQFSSSRKIAWKTGTSHGFKDAWAIGFDAENLVAVWVGNADGEGRPGLTGTSTAAPLMFEIFQLLPRAKWFGKPNGSLKTLDLCTKSGMLPNAFCPTASVESPRNTKSYGTCTMHKPILVNDFGERVRRNCAIGSVHDTIAFVLDPVSSYFYKKRNAQYIGLPPYSEECMEGDNSNLLAIIYPTDNAEIIVPRNLGGSIEKIQFKATSSKRNAILYWHLDDVYLGSTDNVHELTAELKEGEHTLLIMDETGQQSLVKFSVYGG